MSKFLLGPHGHCLSSPWSLRGVAVGLTANHDRRLYSTPRDAMNYHVERSLGRQRLLEKQIRDLNANPNMTDIQKHGNSTRLYYDLEQLKAQIQANLHFITFRNIYRKMPPIHDRARIPRQAHREIGAVILKLDSALKDAFKAHQRAFAPTVFAPWADLGLTSRLVCIVAFLWDSLIKYPNIRGCTQILIRSLP